MESEVAKWYQGRSVLITGATGFMGQTLVEKLLRSCPNVGTIFLLVRKKKGISSQERVHQMLTHSMFKDLHAAQANPKDRLVAIPGDIDQPDLGISNEDRCLLRETVSVVFHLAATVKFDEPLRTAITVNVDGTEALLRLAQGMANLSAVVHVSTAYSNCTIPIVQERVYPPPLELEKVRYCVAGLNDDILESIKPRLIDKHPNTYTFTKALAEHVVAGYSSELPIVIVRPSIVLAAWREPVPGWVAGYNGPTALVIGAGKGLLNSVYGNTEAVADLIPVDICINLVIAAAWEIGSREGKRLVPDVLVYNCASGTLNPVTWGFFAKVIAECIQKYAMSDVVMNPKLSMTGSRVRHTLIYLLSQKLPGILIDCFSRMSGGKPRLQRNQRKINQVAKILEFFTTQGWSFESQNVKRLRDRLSPDDGKTFDFDVTKIVWEDYIVRYFLGVRRNVMHEEDETLDTSRRRVARLAMIPRIACFGILGILAVSVSFAQFRL